MTETAEIRPDFRSLNVGAVSNQKVRECTTTISSHNLFGGPRYTLGSDIVVTRNSPRLGADPDSKGSALSPGQKLSPVFGDCLRQRSSERPIFPFSEQDQGKTDDVDM